MSASPRLFTNARIVTRTEIVRGTLVIDGGRVAEVGPGASAAPGAADMGGDWVLPGLVELHTDNVERHLSPRPGVAWPAAAAVAAHDAELAANGITTVFDAVRAGELREEKSSASRLGEIVAAADAARGAGLLRVDHYLHIRCEVGCADTATEFAALADHPALRLVSLMDHTPGQRQFADEARYRQYYQGKYQLTDRAMDELMERQRTLQAKYGASNRRRIVAMARERGLALASHDDATPEHVREAAADGMRIAEFPTSLAAAELSRAEGMAVLMGAPNAVRGESHSGNISALGLARSGALDILSSDYIPASLMQAAFRIAAGDAGIDLPAAVRMMSLTPAEHVGFGDRGALEPGRRADFVRVAQRGDSVVVRETWCGGERVA
ncbi:MAG: alpha-D-ribose 1-methylphosphonate 5-triphosphate diphosphatase [Rhodospirillaceae bacterium]|nr:alpha-D-ribose 1-methylphosphonate 5-triphosphate diphosphatase [Rhodospirillaceae bacterium]